MVQKLLYVYILECADGNYYTGVTNNPERRLLQHNSGINEKSYTFSRRPVKMVFTAAYSDFKLAINWEKRIKNWSQAKKKALITGKWDDLKKAAACKNSSSHKSYNKS